jgi:hypothetical protein
MRQNASGRNGLVVACVLSVMASIQSQAGAQSFRDPKVNEIVVNNNAAVANSGAALADHDNGNAPKLDAGHLQDLKGETQLTRLPAHLAFRGLSDSKEYKNMFREMVTSQVPVMFQTMMMVENGAATGYIGALQSVSNLLRNQVQAADLELKMRRVADSTGASEKDYVNAVFEGMKRNQASEYSWPLGLAVASGDEFTGQLNEKLKIDNELRQLDFGGASNVDHLPKEWKDKNQNKYTWLLSDVMWGDNSSTDQRVKDLKKLQTEVLGDVEFKATKPAASDPKVTVTKTYKEPTIKKLRVKGESGGTGIASTGLTTMATSQSPAPREIKGINSYRQKRKEEVWEGMYEILDEYCKFKTNDENARKNVFQKVTAASKIRKEMLNKVSSPNMTVTINLIDQVFKIWVQTAGAGDSEPTKIKCDFSQKDPTESMPDDWETPNKKFDDCETKPKQCIRNKWLYKFVDIVSYDALLEDVRGAYEKGMLRLLASDPSLGVAWQELMCGTLNAAMESTGDYTMCDVGYYLEQEAGKNRARWHTELEDLAKLAQSLGGASNFRFQPNNSLSVAGGGVESTMPTGGGNGS